MSNFNIKNDQLFITSHLDRKLCLKLTSSNNQVNPSVTVNTPTVIRTLCPIPELNLVAGGGEDGLIRLFDY